MNVVIECTVDDIYETKGFESFICKIDHVYAEETALNENGKLSYHTLKPVLFEMPTSAETTAGERIYRECSKNHGLKDRSAPVLLNHCSI